MNASRRTRLLIATNGLLLVLLTAVCIHERYIQRLYARLTAPVPRPYVYTDNTYFGEELDFGSLYAMRPAIVMLGNSMTRKMAWNELLGRCDIANRGVNLDVTDGMLARTDSIIAMHPKIVFVEGGINDIDMGRPVAAIAENICRIARKLQGAGILPVLTLVTHVTAAYPESKAVNAKIAQLNTALSRVASGSRLDVINLNAVIAPEAMLDTAYARADGCHLDAKAYRVWKDQIERILAAHGI